MLVFLALLLTIKIALKNAIIITLKNYDRNNKKMSFLKITDPTKRDQTVKEYLELKKNIRDNLLAERTGEQQLQTELTKFYRPITESQKATAREITEGLRPIREGIENLPKAEKDPAYELFVKKITELEKEKKEEEEEEEEEDLLIGDIANKYLSKPFRDTTFGVHKEGDHHYIGNKHVIITEDDDIVIKESGDRFLGTKGLWELITSKKLSEDSYDEEDYMNYERLMVKTNALHRDYNPTNPLPRGSKSDIWKNMLAPIWHTREKYYEGKGVVIMSSDPNALLERLDLLLASQEAGHTGVVNKLVSICDELKRQGVLDTNAYKKLNSIIKNDST